MRETPYYSVRTGINPMSQGFDLETLKKLFDYTYGKLETDGYFQESFGICCERHECTYPGKLGSDSDIEALLILRLRKDNIWPIYRHIDHYSEDDLFDVLEFVYDNCSKPIDNPQDNSCAIRDCNYTCRGYVKFDKKEGRVDFRRKLNEILKTYGQGYELSEEGEMLVLAESGLEHLLEAPLPICDSDNVEAKVDAAKRKFRRSRSTMDERRDALRELADVLEYLRPKIKGAINSQDEGDLFNIVNNFGLRHHNESQKTDYDKPIFYSWLFYYYLAAIHASTRLIERSKKPK